MLKSAVFITLLFITLDVVVSKPDYLFNEEVNGWLKLHAVPMTWQDALKTCHYEGAVLASPINAILATALSKLVNHSALNNTIHLGVSSLSGGDFVSIEGVPFADLSINWGSYAGENLSEHCLSLSTDGKTYITSCSKMLPYICYKHRDRNTFLNQCGNFDDDYHLNQATGSCYKNHKKPKTWLEAHKICTDEGGHLVIINDKQEADFVTSFLNKSASTMSWGDAALVGMIDRHKDLSFYTLDGQKVENVYNEWAPGQPDNRGVNLCGIIYPEGTLDDFNCNNERRTFICEKDPHSLRFENPLWSKIMSPSKM